jgi:hypothetical protein
MSSLNLRQGRLMSVPRPLQLDLGELRELHLNGLHVTPDGVAVGETEAGPFRVEIAAPGIVRLRLGAGDLPDYGLVTDDLRPPPQVVVRSPQAS